MAKNSRIAPPSAGNGRASGSSTTPCDRSNIEIIDVEWLESYPLVCQKDNRITDWQVWKSSASTTTTQVDPANFFYQDCSDKPAVYFISHSPAQHHKKIKIKVILKKICGTRLPSTALNEKVNLIISFGNKEFISNDFYLPATEANETVIIEGDVDHISWLKSPIFSLKYKNNGVIVTKNNITPQKIPLEAFVLYDEPANFYTKGVWVETLRFLFNNTGITEDKDIILSAGKITHYCNSQHGMEYDTERGRPFYKVSNNSSAVFLLLSYMKKTPRSKTTNATPKVNCVDQGCAIRFLGGALGLYIEPVQMKPFGYINVINLVGIGRCNNPFINRIFPGYSNEKEFSGLTDKNSQKKTDFGMHHFARLAGTTNDKWDIKDSKILDACALPILANGNLDQTLYSLSDYLLKSIDMPLNRTVRMGITEIKSSGKISAYRYDESKFRWKYFYNSGNAKNYTGKIFQDITPFYNLQFIYM